MVMLGRSDAGPPLFGSKRRAKKYPFATRPGRASEPSHSTAPPFQRKGHYW